VIGPEANESLVLDSIIAGARAYLDFSASPRMVRQALDVVISGSIWAPRRLLSKLIDRLLSTSDSSPTNSSPHLTARERQVLELILKARSNREIAHELGIEERTVKSHVGRLMRKTGSDNRIALSMRALSGAFHPRLGHLSTKETLARQIRLPMSPLDVLLNPHSFCTLVPCCQFLETDSQKQRRSGERSSQAAWFSWAWELLFFLPCSNPI